MLSLDFSVISSTHLPWPQMISRLLFVHSNSTSSFLSSISFLSFNSLDIKDFSECPSRSKKQVFSHTSTLRFIPNLSIFHFTFPVTVPKAPIIVGTKTTTIIITIIIITIRPAPFFRVDIHLDIYLHLFCCYLIVLVYIENRNSGRPISNYLCNREVCNCSLN